MTPMRALRRFAAVLSLLVLAAASPAFAKDLFVKAGATGDGSKASPFGDPWEALDKCEAGDAIHIAEGRYTGKLGNGEWLIPFANVQLLGGYTADFAGRDPWAHQTLLVWDRNSKNRPKGARLEIKEKGCVVDGIVFDGVEQNEYSDEKKSGREQRSLDSGEEMVRCWLAATVRNCIFLNTGRQGLVCRPGATVENNLFMNCFDSAIKINSLPAGHEDAKTPAVIKNNTILWVWDDRAVGKGGYQGTGIYSSGPAAITGNIIAFCDNNGIYAVAGVDRSTISGNQFFMNRWSNFMLGEGGKKVVVDDKTMDLLEEAGLKAAEGNKAASPNLALDKEWMEGTTKRTMLDKGKVEMDDMNKLRQTLGMDLRGSGGAPASGVAPAYPLAKAVALLDPKDAGTAGARIKKLEPKFSGGDLAGPAKTYEKKEITAWASNPDSVDGKPLEMVVAVSTVANIGGIPDAFKPADHEGIRLHDQNGTVRVTGFYKKGSAVQRAVTEAAGRYDGNGKADRLYTVKGTAYVVKNVPKAGFFIESFTPFEATSLAQNRAKGRDWFIKAGSSGGDGSKEKPFRDPYQALEKCEAGDTLHVAGGEYVGKLRAGHWKIDCKDVAMLGGYTADFSARDPWKNATLLYCPADFKGTRGGYTLEGEGEHDNFILDGFVFDKKLNNVYDKDGNLQYMESDKTEHLWLARPGCVVRNCVFMNGAHGAARLSSAQTIENNLFLNHHIMAVSLQRTFKPEIPTVVRNNTFAFAWEKRFGQGHGLTADLLIIERDVRAVIDNNIFAFADQHAIRINGNTSDIELTNNTFAQNLFANIYITTGDLFIDNEKFADLRTLGFKKLEGNVVKTPALPVDEKWFNTYLTRTAYVPGKVKMDEWNQLREMLGQPMIATGGSPGTGLAPAYDRAKAMEIFPKAADVKGGYHTAKIDVKFEGVARAANSNEYEEVKWDDVQAAGNWDKLKGKRIALKVVIARGENQWPLEDIKKDDYNAWMIRGPIPDSPGLPMRAFTAKSTRTDRVFQNAKGYSSGAVEETHMVKGVARENRQLVVEAAEKAD